mgnify:CR=1 FL=1
MKRGSLGSGIAAWMAAAALVACSPPGQEQPEAQAPVYSNRRRIRGRRGRRLMRRRGETIERSFAHVYDTGGMRRTHLRGHPNILKRLLIHAGGFNLGLIMRPIFGVGTPRGLQGRLAAAMAVVIALWTLFADRWTSIRARPADRLPLSTPSYCFELLSVAT